MNPLVVEGSVGEEVDALLVYLQPLGDSKFFSQVCGKLVVAVND
jgi:hypothetical protein